MNNLSSSPLYPSHTQVSATPKAEAAKISPQESEVNQVAQAAVTTHQEPAAAAPLSGEKVKTESPTVASKVDKTVENRGVISGSPASGRLTPEQKRPYLPMAAASPLGRAGGAETTKPATQVGKLTEEQKQAYVLNRYRDTKETVISNFTPETKRKVVLDRYKDSDYRIVTATKIVRTKGGEQRDYRVGGHLGEGGFSQVKAASPDTPDKKSKAVKMTKDTQDSRALLGVYNHTYACDKIQEMGIKGHDGGPVQGIQKLPKAILDLGDGVHRVVYSKADFDLEKKVYEHGGLLPPKQLFKALTQLADGLAVFHQINFVHRDLKPDNVLLTMEENAQTGEEEVKTCYWHDYDGSQILDQTSVEERGKFTCTPVYTHLKDMELDVKGMSEPEFVEAGKAHDVHAFGVMLLWNASAYEVMVGDPDDPSDPPRLKSLGEDADETDPSEGTVREGIMNYFRGNEQVGEKYLELFTQMTADDYRQRPSMEEVRTKLLELQSALKP